MSRSSMNTLGVALVPGMTPVFGTQGNDTIAATAALQALYGRAGDDLLSSLFNTTAIFGGAGNDRVAVDLDIVDDGSSAQR